MTRLIDIARTAAFAGLISGCIAVSAPAFAADDDALPQGALIVRGADFTSPPAVAQLKRHLRRIAMNICTTGDRGLISRSEQACYDTALKDGLTQIASRQQQAQLQVGRDRAVRLAATSMGASSAQ